MPDESESDPVVLTHFGCGALDASERRSVGSKIYTVARKTISGDRLSLVSCRLKQRAVGYAPALPHPASASGCIHKWEAKIARIR